MHPLVPLKLKTSKTKQEAIGLKILYKAQVMYVFTYIYVVVVEVPRLGAFLIKLLLHFCSIPKKNKLGKLKCLSCQKMQKAFG